LLYAEQIDGQEVFTYKVKVMRRHDDTWQFGFSDKDNKSEIERETNEAKLSNQFLWVLLHVLQH